MSSLHIKQTKIAREKRKKKLSNNYVTVLKDLNFIANVCLNRLDVVVNSNAHDNSVKREYGVVTMFRT